VLSGRKGGGFGSDLQASSTREKEGASACMVVLPRNREIHLE